VVTPSFAPAQPIVVIDVGSGTININFFVLTEHKLTLRIKYEIPAKLAEETGIGHRLPKPVNVEAAIVGLSEIFPIVACFPDVRIVGTSVLREIQTLDDGRIIIQNLQTVLGGRLIHILSGEEEADYMGRAIVSEFPAHFQSKDKRSSLKKGFIGIGGGSIQTGIFRRNNVTDLSSIAYGVQTLSTESGGDLAKAIQLLSQHLPNMSSDTIDTLYATGGNWRAIAKLITKTSTDYSRDDQSKNAVILSFKQAKAALTGVIRGDFKLPKNSDRTKQEISVAAQALMFAGEKYCPQEIILCDSTMRHGIAADPEFHMRFTSPKLAA